MPNDALARLGEDYWDWVLRENPVQATWLGDSRFNDRLTDLSPAGRDRRRADLRGFLARLAPIEGSALEDEDRVNAEVLRLACESALEEERHKFWQWEVDQMSGPQSEFPQLLNVHPHDDVGGLESRYRAFPAYIGQYLDNLRAGAAEGRTAVLAAVDRVVGQLRALLAVAPESSVFAVNPALVPAVRDAVYPAYRAMLTYLDRDYRPHARTGPVGLGALPGGREAYAFRVRHHTTTGLAPREIHEIGLVELAGIEDEMRRIAGPDLEGFQERLRKDPRNFFASPEELLRTARQEQDRAAALLPRWFGRLPKTACEVKAIEAYREKDSVAAFYYPPDEALTRPGIYYLNTHEPGSRARYALAALSAHEAVPGHHLQIAIAMELEALPRFRRNASFTAYIEGWGLYAERLADEMGLYSDELSRFGMLTYQAWRACRLVVDTGLHELGWTRDQAVEFMLGRVPISHTEVLNEVDRYIIWPGQALAYMIGMREIRKLREEARAARGARFDLRAFHDEVLRSGALPLTTLRRRISAWAAAR